MSGKLNDISCNMLNNSKLMGGGAQRSSNLELYRIVCMFLILTHHFSQFYYYSTQPFSSKVVFLNIFGMWGKTGINCFLLITGYFMCQSNITVRKFLKLILEVYLYKLIIFVLMLIGGYETINPVRIVKLVMPVWNIEQNFLSCFILFWVTIPFWNILIRNMTKRQHELLLVILLGMYTFLGSIPGFHVSLNYVTWYGVIYLIASYVRFYPILVFENKKLWGCLTFISVVVSIVSVFAFKVVTGSCSHFMVHDSNKFLAVTTAFTSFMWFKNMDIKNSRVINAIGGSTFAVLLIHSNSEAMRTWLWKDFVNCVGHYSLPFGQFILFTICTAVVIFTTCIVIDRFRIKVLEEPFFKWYDKKFATK